jgi:myosin-5
LKYKLADARTFHYLNQSPVFELNNVNNAQEYLKTRRAMDVVGISTDEQVQYVVDISTSGLVVLVGI